MIIIYVSNFLSEIFSKNLKMLSGLGAPWLIASIYWEITDPLTGFNVKAAGLEFSTTLYIILGIIGRTGFVGQLT